MPTPAQKQNLVEEFNALFEQVLYCTKCALCTGPGQHRRVFDRALMLFLPWERIDAVFIVPPPNDTDIRTGFPMSGAHEVLASRCGKCVHLVPCHAHALHKDGQYGGKMQPCLYAAEGEAIEEIQDATAMQKRLQRVPPDMIYSPDNQDVEDPRIDGVLFNTLLSSAGFIRSSNAEYWALKRSHLDPTAALRHVNCAVVSATACRSAAVQNDRIVDAPLDAHARFTCANWSHALIKMLQPRMIVACGGDALVTATGDSALRVSKTLNSQLQYCQNPKIPVFVDYHPIVYRHSLSVNGLDAYTQLLNQRITRLTYLRQTFVDTLPAEPARR